MVAIHKISKREFLMQGLTAAGAIALSPMMSFADPGSKNLWKWSKEGQYWSPTPRGTKCLICPNECVIKEGESGDCHNRVNKDGKLYSIAYGNPCAVNVDPIEKKPFHHFLP